MALSSPARAWTAAGGAKRNSAAGSMNRVISHGQATRSIFGRSRVMQRIATSDQGWWRQQVDYNKCIIEHRDGRDGAQPMPPATRQESMNRRMWPLARPGVGLVAFGCGGPAGLGGEGGDHARADGVERQHR